MRYYSTEDATLSVGFMEAVLAEHAADGGLFLPDTSNHSPIAWTPDFAEFTAQFLFSFMQPDLGRVETLSVVRRAFTFPVQWRELSRRRYQLELFHGPTGSFRDFGAQLLAQITAATPAKKQRLVMLATNGEAGSAIAAAFGKQSDVQVVLLYPKNSVQEQTIESWGGHVKSFVVDGSLEDCQKMISACLEESAIQQQFSIIRANETNVVWLLSQMAYYAYSSLLSERLHRQPMSLIIPTGNCGHVAAACLVRAMGYPIDEIVAAQNANRPLVDYVATGFFREKPCIDTLIKEMDVNNPSSFSRLRSLFASWEEFADSVQAYSVIDDEIREAIKACYKKTGTPLCPQSAVAYAGLPEIESDPRAWTIAATAHPAKYSELIEPLTGQEIQAFSLPYGLCQMQCVPTDQALLNEVVLSLCSEACIN